MENVILLVLYVLLDTPSEMPKLQVVSTSTVQTSVSLIEIEEPLFRINTPTNIDVGQAGQVSFTPPIISPPAITNISVSISVDLQLPTFSGLWIE